MADTTMFDAFAFLCALLSPFTAEEEVHDLRQVAARGHVDWQELAGAANRSGLAPALFLALDRTGIWAEVPETFRAYLEEIHCFNSARNEALLGQLLEVVQLLNGIGVTPLLLKGGAALATDLFPGPGMRFMWDLDLLVPEERLEQSVAALLAAGYEVSGKQTGGVQTPMASAASNHHAPLIRPGAPASVELHRRVLGNGLDLLKPGEVWGDCRLYTGWRLPGVSAALMSPTDELIYCFAHSELAHGHHRYCRVDARHLHHFAYLCCRDAMLIDWNRVAALKQHPQHGQMLNAYLYMATCLFKVNMPVSFDPDPYVDRHYRTATAVRKGWKRWLHPVRMIPWELVRAFSREHLRDIYQREIMSITRLRLQHLCFLLGKYARLEAWLVKLRSMAPF